MPQIIRRISVPFLIPIFLLVTFTSWGSAFRQMVYENVMVSSVYAEDDEEDEEDEEDDDNYSATTDTSSSSTSTKTKSTPTYKTVYVTKVITTLDPKFTTDTDKDGIVDGLDPHPTISEIEFFTDDDNDGIPNAFDTHPGEDDYAYFEQDQDANNNGILDSFESLGGY